MTTRFRVSATTVWPLVQWRRLAWGAAAFLLSVSTAWAVPQGGEIVRGEGKISMSNPYTLRIFQGSNSMAIDWTSFNIAANERVVFEQPSSSASALNRIFDQNPSQIFGVIDANGRVFLINPNGMVFGRSAQINLNSLVASSLGMSVDDFMAGNYTLEALADHNGGTIINRGTIQAADGGSIALIGNAVINEGVLVANYGSVNLGAGRAATLDFTGEGLMLFTLDEGAIADDSGLAGAVHNSGGIFADGGQVLLTASAANDVLSSVVNNSGVIRAGRIDDTGGVIRLVADGGAAVNSGELDARGLTSGDTGGSIAMLGDSVTLQTGATVDASGPAGGGDIRLGGDFHGAGELQTAQFTDIEAGVTIAANAGVAGDGGTVVVWSDDTTTFKGDVSVQGGQLAGDGGSVEISGAQHLVFKGQVDGRAANGRFGSLLIDPGTVTVCHENGTTCVQGAMDRFTDVQIEGLLDLISTTISTAVDGVAGPLDIIFEDDTISISWVTASVLELFAGRNVILDGTINTTLGSLIVSFGQSEAGVFTLASTASLSAADIDITGGAFGNMFNIGASFSGDLFGGTGADNFILADGVTIDGSIDGGAGTDTLDWSAYTTARAVTLATVGVMDGVAGMEASITGGFDNIDVLTGGMAGDSLTGANVATTWNVSVADDGTVDLGSDLTDDVAFSSIENLTGGTLADDFEFADGATISGSIDGGLGTDTLDWSAYTTARAVTLATVGVMDGVAGMEASITGGFDNIDVLTGGMAGDSLTGANVATTWNVSVADDGTVDLGSDLTDDVAFSSIENLTGGTLADDFEFADGATISGSIDGGLGTDTLDWSAYTTARAVTLATVGVMDGVAGMEASITGGFDNIDVLTGGMAGDSLTGANVATTWNVSVADDGTVDLGSDLTDDVAFSSIENLTGGTLADDFEFADGATISGSIDGGLGTDTLDWSAYTTARAVTLATVGVMDGVAGMEASITGGFDNIDVLTGGMAGDSLTGADVATTWNVSVADDGTVDLGSDLTDDVAFSSIENLTGGTLADDFEFADGATISGSIDGGLGTDTLDWSAYTTARAVTLATVGVMDGVAGMEASITGGFDNIDVLTGGMAGDSLTGANVATTWTISGADDGTVDLGSDMTDDVAFTGIENLTGNAGADDFVFGALGSLSGLIDGMGGADTASWAAIASGLTVTLGVDVINVETLTGGDSAATSSFTLAGGSDWDVTGANDGTVDTITFFDFGNLTGTAGADSFSFADGATISGSIDGGDGTDTLDWSAYTTARTVMLTAAGTIDGVAGNEASITGGFDNIDALIGSGVVGDELQSGAGNDLWTVDTVQVGGVGLVAFSDFEVLDAGAGFDSLQGPDTGGTWTVNMDGSLTIPFSVGNISDIEQFVGGNGVDIFDIGFNYTGNLAGGGGEDIFNLTAGIVTGTLFGNDGADNFFVTNGSATLIDGGAGNDTLYGNDMANSWLVDALYGGSLNLDAFTGIENLVGGSDDDEFDIRGAGVVDSIVGGDAVTGDSLTYEFFGGPAMVTLTGVDALGFGGMGSGLAPGGSFAGIDVVTGSGAGNMLTGLDAMATWTLLAADANTYASGGFTLDFSGFESLVGGSADDTFAVNVDPTVVISVDGGAGLSGVATDLLTYAGFGGPVAVTLNAAGGTGYGGTEAALGTFANIDNVIGTGAGDVLTGLNAMATWTLLAADANTYASGGFTLDFSGFESLVGGTADDTFAVNVDPTVVTSVDGGAGLSGVATDLLTYAGFAGPVAVTFNAAGGTGYGGTEAALGTFANIENLIGTGAGDVLTGLDAMATWTLLAADANTYASGGFTLDFSGFENLVGGTANDTFAVNTDPTVVTSVDGGAGLSGVATDLLTYAGFAGPVAVTLNAAGGMGYAGTEATLGTFANIENLIGTGVADTLTGLNAMATWTLLAADANTYASGGFTLAFSGFESLVGGTADDTFAVNVDPTVVTSVDGGAGLSGDATDLLTYAGFAGPVAVTLNTAAATGYAGTEAALGTFANIENVIGTGAGDTLTGLNAMATWTLLAADANTYASGGFTLDFSGFENLVGGTANDTFAVNADPTVVTSVDGGAGLSGVATDLLTYAGFAGPVAVTLNTAAATGYAGTEAALGTFANIENLIGTGVADTLTGLNAVATWTLLAGSDSYSSGGFDLEFSDFENLVGGSGNDLFAVFGGLASSIDGGFGFDELTYAGFGSTVAVTLTADNASGFSGLGNAIGTFAGLDYVAGSGLSGDTLTGLNADATWTLGDGILRGGNSSNTYTNGGELGFTDFENLTGGTGNDTFVVTPNPSPMVTLSDLGGDDELSYANFGGAIIVTLTAGAADGFSGLATGITSFSGIDSVVGSGLVDTLTGLDADATWMLMAMDANTYSSGGFTLDFSGFENFNGGSMVDTFMVESLPAAMDVTIAAGGGNDLIQIGTNDVGVAGTLTFDGGADNDSLQTAGGTVMAAVLSIIDIESIGISAADRFLTSVTSLQLSGIGDAFIGEEGDIDLNGVVASGNFDLSAAGMVTDTAALDVGGSTAITGNTGIVLDNAANIFGGPLSLTTNADATIAAASDVTLDDSVIGDNLSVTTAGALMVDGAVTAGANVGLMAGGTIAQGAGGAINANALTATASGGIVLGGANNVTNFSAANTGSGNITLANTGALTLSGISQSGGGDVNVTNAGALTLAGDLLNSAGEVTLSVDGAITQDSGIIEAASLTAMSNGGLTLEQGNLIAAFGGMNASGSVTINNTIALELLGYAQSGGGSFTLDNVGTITQTGALTTNGGEIDIETTSGNILLTLLDADDGMVTVFAMGNIYNEDGVGLGQAVINADNIFLTANTGQIGQLGDTLFVTAPNGAGEKLIVTEAQLGSIDTLVPFPNRSSTNVGTFSTLNRFSAIAAAGQSTGLVQLVLDAAAFETGVTMYSVVEPSLLLPCDQLVEDDPRCSE